MWWKYPPSLGPATAVFCKIRLDVFTTVVALAAALSGLVCYILIPDGVERLPVYDRVVVVFYGLVLSLATGIAIMASLTVLERSSRFGEQFRIHRNGVSESRDGKFQYILSDDVTHISHNVVDRAKARFITIRILSVDKSVNGSFSVQRGSRKEAIVLELVRRLQRPYR
jgi:hypothetical protein